MADLKSPCGQRSQQIFGYGSGWGLTEQAADAAALANAEMYAHIKGTEWIAAQGPCPAGCPIRTVRLGPPEDGVSAKGKHQVVVQGALATQPDAAHQPGAGDGLRWVGVCIDIIWEAVVTCDAE
jgi:hypothetical protein